MQNALPDVLCVVQVALEGAVSKKAALNSLAQGNLPQVHSSTCHSNTAVDPKHNQDIYAANTLNEAAKFLRLVSEHREILGVAAKVHVAFQMQETTWAYCLRAPRRYSCHVVGRSCCHRQQLCIDQVLSLPLNFWRIQLAFGHSWHICHYCSGIVCRGAEAGFTVWGNTLLCRVT